MPAQPAPTPERTDAHSARQVHIDADDALALLTEAVAARGAHHVEYRRRYTFTTGAPCCIAGHALHGGGVSLDRLAGLDRTKGGAIDAEMIWTVMPGITAAACTIFQAAQEVQDDRRTWGEALRAAQDTHAQLAAQDEADAAAAGAEA